MEDSLEYVEPIIGKIPNSEVNTRAQESVLKNDQRVETSLTVCPKSKTSSCRKLETFSTAPLSDSESSRFDSEREIEHNGRRRKSGQHHPVGRRKDKSHPGCNPLCCTKTRYSELFAYRYYRVNKISQKRTKYKIVEVNNVGKRMPFSLPGHKNWWHCPYLCL